MVVSSLAHPLDQWIAKLCGQRVGESLPEAVERFRLTALNTTLDHVRRSRFYGSRRPALPDSLLSLRQLSDLPFTTAQDLTRWGDLLCVSQGEVARMVTLQTSGTTGTPRRLAFGADELARTVDFFRVGMGQLVQPCQTLAVLMPGAYRPHGVTDLLRQALPESFVVAATLADVRGLRPHVLVLLPAQLQALCMDVSQRPWPELSGVLTSGEVLGDALRASFARWLPTGRLLDHYGLTESCFGGGVECAAQDGYHVRCADLFVEIVDMDGRSLPHGEWGEVVLTTLTRRVMPLIRYRTGDVSRLLIGPCPCGSPLERLDRVRGRLQTDGKVEAVPKGLAVRE